jgi:hypothetical protein
MNDIIIDAGEYIIRDTDAQRWADLMAIRIDCKEDKPHE